MTVKNIIDCLTDDFAAHAPAETVCTDKGFMIQKKMVSHPTFKAYKIVRYILWFLDGTEKRNVLEENYTEKIIDDNKKTMMEKLDVRFVRSVIGYVSSDKYRELIREVFDGYRNE